MGYNYTLHILLTVHKLFCNKYSIQPVVCCNELHIPIDFLYSYRMVFLPFERLRTVIPFNPVFEHSHIQMADRLKLFTKFYRYFSILHS